MSRGRRQEAAGGLSVAQLDALALQVRSRAARYLNAIEMVKELVVNTGERQEQVNTENHDLRAGELRVENENRAG